MDSREDIRRHIVANGTEYVRYRTWAQAGESRSKGLLLETLPSGFAEWFAIKADGIWWIYMDTSDGGTWGPNGPQIKGYRVDHSIELAKAIYGLVSPAKTHQYKNRK
ncbi:hypothetical protein [Stutzerimonas nitrititolerans]|uniref:hypothetical protein n=1 Tax=Stutzerimonas nitrititolerans TaxID=2482751 RepID=UPI001124D705|nr:hypothetical protein [Stutzerimonas nitrititolerans]